MGWVLSSQLLAGWPFSSWHTTARLWNPPAQVLEHWEVWKRNRSYIMREGPHTHTHKPSTQSQTKHILNRPISHSISLDRKYTSIHKHWPTLPPLMRMIMTGIDYDYFHFFFYSCDEKTEFLFSSLHNSESHDSSEILILPELLNYVYLYRCNVTNG